MRARPAGALSRLQGGWEGGRLMDGTAPSPLVVSGVSNRGRDFILQVADLMIQEGNEWPDYLNVKYGQQRFH